MTQEQEITIPLNRYLELLTVESSMTLTPVNTILEDGYYAFTPEQFYKIKNILDEFFGEDNPFKVEVFNLFQQAVHVPVCDFHPKAMSLHTLRGGE